jgi:hypothetical protein
MQPTKAELNASRIQTENVIKEVTEEIMSKVKPDDFDTIIVKRLNALFIESFQQFSAMHDIQVTPMKKSDALEHIRKIYKDKLSTWTKDELIESFALVQATLGVESFHDELI